MVNCFVPDCHHRSDAKDRSCTPFKTFPKDKRLRQKWINLIRRADREPSSSSQVCRCHFVCGDTNTLPSIFPFNKKWNERNNSTWNNSHREHTLSDVEDFGDDEFEEKFVSSDDHAVPPVEDIAFHVHEKEMKLLREEIERLKIENLHLKKSHLAFATITENEQLCYHYTGLSVEVVYLLRDLLLKISEKHTINSVKILTIDDQLLLTLLRLRRNLSYKDLAFRFGVSYSVVQSVFTSILPVFHEVLFKNFMSTIPSREKVEMFTPECFKLYPNVRIVLDCTEIPCDIPRNMEKQKATYSPYKSRNTAKYEVGCAVNGSVIYCSPAFPGCTSDRAIVEHTGIISELLPGDMVLADKGFTISDLLPPGVALNIPPFLDNPQFEDHQVFDCRNKARGRIHIERINARLKRFLICTHIPHKLFRSCDMIVQTCCALVNLQSPVMGECKDFFKSLLNIV